MKAYPLEEIILDKNCRLVNLDEFSESDDDINRFTLIEIDDETYEKFKNRLYQKLKEICMKS